MDVVDHNPAEKARHQITITADVHVSASAEVEFSDLGVGLKEEQDCGTADQSSFCHALSLGPVSSTVSTDVRAQVKEPNTPEDGSLDRGEPPAISTAEPGIKVESEDTTGTEAAPTLRLRRRKTKQTLTEQESDEDPDIPDDKRRDEDFNPAAGPRRSSRTVKRVLPKSPVRIQPSPAPGNRQITAAPAVQAARTPEPAISCSNCRKDLCTGQTAYQRKGQPQLFCSSDCLTYFNRKPVKKNLCAYCAKDLTNDKSSMIAQVGQSFKEFCNGHCLRRYEDNSEKPKAPSERSSDSSSEHPLKRCSVCNLNRKILHEVNTGTIVHLICTEACFNTFRTMKGLKTSCCDTCGTYINQLASKPKYLFHDGQQRRFCSSSTCMELYKMKNTKVQLCHWCKTLGKTFEMLSCVDASGKTQSFCSSWCITSYKVDLGMSGSEARNQLQNCSMCSTTIQQTQYYCKPNKTVYAFCSPGCWSDYQSKNPHGLIYLNCHSCHNMFRTNPEILEWQGSTYQFCSKNCCQDYKKQNGVIAMCDQCKIEKVLYEKLVFSDVEKTFCSHKCGLLFREDYTYQLGVFCVNCSYCRQTCSPAITEEREGRKWSFCSADCKKKYLQWYMKVASCKTCQKQGVNLRETIFWKGEVFHFCNQQCLLYFYSVQAKVALNLQDPPKMLNSLSTGTMLPTAATKKSEAAGKASSMSRPGTTSAPSLPTKQHAMMNKAVMCRPMLATVATTCKPEMKSQSCQTDEYLASPPLILPIPVPVYVPLPLQMYCQYVPVSMAFPLSLPVPMFLPSTLDQIVEHIKELQLSMPSKPAKNDVLNESEAQGDASLHPDTMDGSSGEEQTTAEAEAQSDASQHSDAINGGVKQEQQMSDPAFSDCSIGNKEMLVKSDRSPGEERHKAQRGPSAEYPSDQRPSPPEQSPSIPSPERPAMSEMPQSDPLDSQSLDTTLDSSCGVEAWRSWVQNKRSITENSKEKPFELNEDLLECSPAELDLGLSQFVRDITSPRGPSYRPDGTFYLCLGIQNYLLENNRRVDIFTDQLYVNFAKELNGILKGWLPNDIFVSRVMEEHLWQSKQLGVFSTVSLLHTLVFFNTKYFGLRTVEQHLQLSFNNVRVKTIRAPKSQSRAKETKVVCYQPTSDPETTSGAGSTRKRRRNDPPELTQQENSVTRHRCPVTVFAFYLSKCPDSVKNSPTSIYLRPEPDCTVHSKLWYSDTHMERGMLEGMLRRIMAVRDISEKRS